MNTKLSLGIISSNLHAIPGGSYVYQGHFTDKETKLRLSDLPKITQLVNERVGF